MEAKKPYIISVVTINRLIIRYPENRVEILYIFDIKLASVYLQLGTGYFINKKSQSERSSKMPA